MMDIGRRRNLSNVSNLALCNSFSYFHRDVLYCSWHDSIFIRQIDTPYFIVSPVVCPKIHSLELLGSSEVINMSKVELLRFALFHFERFFGHEHLFFL
jgi:hypothetical protein